MKSAGKDALRIVIWTTGLSAYVRYIQLCLRKRCLNTVAIMLNKCAALLLPEYGHTIYYNIIVVFLLAGRLLVGATFL